MKQTTCFYDAEYKLLHPVPSELVEMISRDVMNGKFSTGIYDNAELAAHEFGVTDGETFRRYVSSKLSEFTAEFMVKRWADSDSHFTLEQYKAYVY